MGACNILVICTFGNVVVLFTTRGNVDMTPPIELSKAMNESVIWKVLFCFDEARLEKNFHSRELSLEQSGTDKQKQLGRRICGSPNPEPAPEKMSTPNPESGVRISGAWEYQIVPNFIFLIATK
jgi:hypothetical protein